MPRLAVGEGLEIAPMGSSGLDFMKYFEAISNDITAVQHPRSRSQPVADT